MSFHETLKMLYSVYFIWDWVEARRKGKEFLEWD